MAAFEEAQSAVLEAHTVDLTGIAIKLAVLGEMADSTDTITSWSAICLLPVSSRRGGARALIIGTRHDVPAAASCGAGGTYERPRLRLGPSLCLRTALLPLVRRSGIVLSTEFTA
jgi:hypothetical protein